ncbi:hypothetical protein Bbelb_230790 [Branchiostoma belcheri]|nr:hypothetical protein Bbelb_230790 [Branchiostoma belcheri]
MLQTARLWKCGRGFAREGSLAGRKHNFPSQLISSRACHLDPSDTHKLLHRSMVLIVRERSIIIAHNYERFVSRFVTSRAGKCSEDHSRPTQLLPSDLCELPYHYALPEVTVHTRRGRWHLGNKGGQDPHYVYSADAHGLTAFLSTRSNCLRPGGYGRTPGKCTWEQRTKTRAELRRLANKGARPSLRKRAQASRV